MAPGDSRDSQHNRRSDGGRRSDRDSNHNRRQDSHQSRDERGSRNSDRRDDRRGGYQGNRSNDGERRGGYQGNRSNDGERRSFGGDRRNDGERRGGYQGNRSNDGERRGGYQGNRSNDGERRGGYQGNRSNDGERRGGYQGNRSNDGERRSFGGDRRDDRRGGYQGNRSNDGERRGGYQGNRSNDGERRSGYQGNRSNDGERRSFGGDRRDDRRGGYQGDRRNDRGGDRRREGGGSDRGGFGRNNNDRRAVRSTETGEYAREQRARRPRIQEPPIPEEVTGKELDKELLGQLRSLDKENAAAVAKHLVSAGGFLDVDPERAYEHAKAAMARAGRVGLVREALGIAAYHVEKYDEAVRELRTHRRISGSDDNIALIADAERGREKPQKALELFESAAELDLDNDARTELVIVAAGAKSDLGDLKGARALIEAEDFTQKPSGALVRLMAAYSEVLRLHGETEMADKYEELSRRTAKATGTLFGDEEPDPNLGVEIETVEEIEDDEPASLDDAPAEAEYGSAHDADAVGMADVDNRDAAELEDAEFDDAETELSTAAGSGADDVDFDDADAEGADEAEFDEDAGDAEADDAPTASLVADNAITDAVADAAGDDHVPAKSKTHVSEKELKKVKVSDEEIEAELDELLEDAEESAASDEETSETSDEEVHAEPEESGTSLKPADNASSEETNVSYRLNGHQ
ncbi:hypothetical protein [Brevibacterium aurantiacum]|uniref:hypothetical protein n=1 Tax=Brevibacterium aurantiacum TaxID=273384 RepID=UPI001F0A2E55|nr:hypothetical protein [Brevibacterium aurantiacum]